MIRLSGSVKLRWAVGVGTPGGCFGLRPRRPRGEPSALVPGSGLGGPRLGLEFRLRRPDPLQPTLLIAHPGRHLVAAPVSTERGVLRSIGALGLRQPTLDLGGQLGLGRAHPGVAHGFVLGGIGAQLGAVQRDMAEPDQARAPAQGEHLHEEFGQGGEVASAELADGAEVRPVQRRHRLEVEALLAGAGDPPRRVDAPAVGVEQQRHHHPRVVRRIAAGLRVGRQDGGEVEFLGHDVADQMRRMTRRHELLHRGRQQPDLIDLPGPEALRHAVERITARTTCRATSAVTGTGS
jgi:hypothetical protein